MKLGEDCGAGKDWGNFDEGGERGQNLETFKELNQMDTKKAQGGDISIV